MQDVILTTQDIAGDDNVLREVLDVAIKQLGLQTGDLSPADAADTLTVAMRVALRQRRSYTGAMNTIALYAHRTELWRLAEVNGETPEEFRDWLRSFDMSAAWVSRLDGASEVVNWLEDEGVKSEHLMSAEKISHLQAALPRLRECKRTGDVSGAAEIVEEVTAAKNRETVRELFADHKEPWGSYARVNGDEYGDQQVLIIRGTPDKLTSIMRKLSGRLENDLIVSTNREQNALEVVIHED